MATFDVNNPPAIPDSDLDSDLALVQNYTIANGATQDIAPGDWIDVDPSVINPDPVWGFSFQVCNMYPNAIGMLVMVDPVNDGYAETQLTPSCITNTFRRLPKVEA